MPWQPRLFWTVLLPALVLFVVLGGFHRWRRLCPLAFFGALGPRLRPAAARRVPAWMERGYPALSLALLAALLALRLLATNGDGRWLAALLVALAVAAAAVNAVFSGKSWCNFLCPVGIVERIYTDPRSFARRANSQCARCTACKKACPDIDQENNYWRELAHASRRVATFAFPGVVLGFYGYFWLRHGDWEAYFDGRWTRRPADAELAFGPGFFFAPQVPAWLAAPATLAGLAALSYALFCGLEAIAGRFVVDAERRRHLVLSLAAFTAFGLFFVFAGAPTLRRIPGATRGFAFLTPAVATLVLAGRWRRSREGYVRDKGAAKLLRNWPFETPPPADPAEAYALVKATEQVREQVLAGYTATLREILQEGIVRDGERRLLDELRKQFGISEREHAQVVAGLEEEERERLAAGGRTGVEARVQLAGYEAALAEALVGGAGAAEIADLRRSFGIDEATHARLAERMRGGSGPLVARARRQLAEAERWAADRALLGRGAPSEARELVLFLLRKAEDRATSRLLDVLESLGEADVVRLCRGALAAVDGATRRAGLRRLAEACPEASDEVARLGRVLAGELAAEPDADESAALVRLAGDADPYLRAGVLWLRSESAGAETRPALLAAAASDPAPLVAVTARALAGRAAGESAASYVERCPVERMQFLRRVPLLASLAADDLEEVAAFAREETVPAEGAICRQGVPDTGDLFVLLEGTAAVLVRIRADDAASEREVAELGPGEVVGELSLLDGSPRSATVRPKGGAVRMLRIPGPAFRTRLLHREAVSRSLLLTLTQRLRRLAGRIAAAEQ